MTIKATALEQTRLEAPVFNIFNLLGVKNKENKTHSAFLAHLLDPEQSHGQQYLLLKAFLNYCYQKFQDDQIPHTNLEDTEWIIRREYHTPFGRLDIMLRCPELGYLCVIENKIYAEERPRQIQRYASWLETKASD